MGIVRGYWPGGRFVTHPAHPADFRDTRRNVPSSRDDRSDRSGIEKRGHPAATSLTADDLAYGGTRWITAGPADQP